jgi:uncharacterized HAD superfamily protein
MRIGFDIDGVLADFASAYQRTVVEVTGRDDFQPGDSTDPPCWDWPEFRGYTAEEMAEVWKRILADPAFWMNLAPFADNILALRTMLHHLERHHEVYYVTNRGGARAKRQTEVWLIEHLRYPAITDVYPTVVLTKSDRKGHLAEALRLDAYIDDNYENCFQCSMHSPTTQTFVLDRRYNRKEFDNFIRVKTLGEMFDKLLKDL